MELAKGYHVSSYNLNKRENNAVGVGKIKRWPGVYQRLHRDPYIEQTEEVINRPDVLPVPLLGATCSEAKSKERGDQPTLINESEAHNSSATPRSAENQFGGGAAPQSAAAATVNVDSISGEKLSHLKRAAGVEEPAKPSPSAASIKAKQRRKEARSNLFSTFD
jgi:hypothetical protein